MDQQGNSEADAAADLSRRHQSEILIDARRRLLKVRSHWYPIMLDLHRFMVAVAWVSVNHDGKGGNAPDPLVVAWYVPLPSYLEVLVGSCLVRLVLTCPG